MANPRSTIVTPTRREALFGLGAGLSTIALTSLVHGEDQSPHHAPKAKRCIFLMMEGGPSHIDTFDPKPELTRQHLKAFTRSGDMESAMSSGKRYFVKSPFEFLQAGQSGADIATPWIHLQEMVDEICFFRGAQVESVNHPTACYQLNTGNQFGLSVFGQNKGRATRVAEIHATETIEPERFFVHAGNGIGPNAFGAKSWVAKTNQRNGLANLNRIRIDGHWLTAGHLIAQ